MIIPIAGVNYGIPRCLLMDFVAKGRTKTMREHKFKAKRLNGQWVEGYYFAKPILCKHFIILGENQWMIDPNTLCEFTGEYDKCGNMIWENDIVSMNAYGGGKCFSKVYFAGGKFAVDGSRYNFKNLKPSTYTVIGNIFDNPELLEGK